MNMCYIHIFLTFLDVCFTLLLANSGFKSGFHQVIHPKLIFPWGLIQLATWVACEASCFHFFQSGLKIYELTHIVSTQTKPSQTISVPPTSVRSVWLPLRHEIPSELAAQAMSQCSHTRNEPLLRSQTLGSQRKHCGNKRLKEAKAVSTTTCFEPLESRETTVWVWPCAWESIATRVNCVLSDQNHSTWENHFESYMQAPRVISAETRPLPCAQCLLPMGAARDLKGDKTWTLAGLDQLQPIDTENWNGPPKEIAASLTLNRLTLCQSITW